MLARVKLTLQHWVLMSIFATLCSVVIADVSDGKRSDDHNATEQTETTPDSAKDSGLAGSLVEGVRDAAPKKFIDKIRVSLKEASTEGLSAVMRDLAGKDKTSLTGDDKDLAIENFVKSLPRLGETDDDDRRIKAEITQLLKAEKDSKTEDVVKTLQLGAIDEFCQRSGLEECGKSKVAEKVEEDGKTPAGEKAGDTKVAAAGEPKGDIKGEVEGSLLDKFKKSLEESKKGQDEKAKNALSELEALSKRLGEFGNNKNLDKGEEGGEVPAGGGEQAAAGGGDPGAGSGGQPSGGSPSSSPNDLGSINDQLARSLAPEREKREKPENKPTQTASSDNDSSSSSKKDDDSSSSEVAESKPKPKADEKAKDDTNLFASKKKPDAGSFDPTIGAGNSGGTAPTRSLGSRTALEPIEASLAGGLAQASPPPGPANSVGGVPPNGNNGQVQMPQQKTGSAISGNVPGGYEGNPMMPVDAPKFSFMRQGPYGGQGGGDGYGSESSDTSGSNYSDSGTRRPTSNDLVSLSRVPAPVVRENPFTVLESRRDDLRKVLGR